MFLINPYILQASGNPLWNGLLAYYTADNTPNDALGTYNGTLVNGTTYGTGIINQGFSLDGVNDYVDFGNNFDNDGSQIQSFSLWYKTSDVTKNQSIFSKYTGSGQVLYGLTKQTNTKLIFIIQQTYPSNMLRVESNTVLINNTWYHITVTYDGSKNASGVKIYINGVESTYNIVADVFTGNSSNTGTFKISSPNIGYIGGLIDELSIFNRVLSSTEATELYNAGAGKQYPN